MAYRDVIVAVHAGAGYHSSGKGDTYRNACKSACSQALECLRRGGPAVDAAAEAVVVLENDPCTNAGVGSSLTLDGAVECDACLMDGRSMLFGAIGALSNHLNPVKIAQALSLAQTKGAMDCGRIPPSVLVGHGASVWAVSNGFNAVDPSNLITESSRQTYCKYRNKLGKINKYKKMSTNILEPEESKVWDTVGAICLDHYGNVAAAASSGGIWLKHPGRLGPAAMFGAASWACNQGRQGEHQPGVAVVASGTGEQLMHNLLARTCAGYIQTEEDTSIAIQKCFQDYNGGLITGGVLVLSHSKKNQGSSVELLWGHSTESMAIGYASGRTKHPKTFISRMNEGFHQGLSFSLGGKYFHL